MTQTASTVEIVPIPEIGYMVFVTRADGEVVTFDMTVGEFERLKGALN